MVDCRECNCIASDRIFPTFNDKRDCIRKSLRMRYSVELSYNYTIDDLLYEKEEEVLWRVSKMREKSLVEHRLYFQHLYDFTYLSPEERAKKKEREKNIRQAKDGMFYVQVYRRGQKHERGPFREVEHAIIARDELVATLPPVITASSNKKAQ